jgi:hypothetical protein
VTILILHPDPISAYQLEKDVLAAGALVFSSGNLTEHVEVSNPYHHASFIYAQYNEAIFGAERSRSLCLRAAAELCIDADVVLSPDESMQDVTLDIAKAMHIPVVRKVEDIFIAPVPVAETKIQYCSGCERTGGNPGEQCTDSTVSCSIFNTLDEAMRGDV